MVGNDRRPQSLGEPPMGRRVGPPMAIGAVIALGLIALAFAFWPEGREVNPTGPAFRAPATTPVTPSAPSPTPPK